MVTFEKKQIFVDGEPIFLLSGETHYFRQPRQNWQHLLEEAKAIGLNCISSYVPWILHEEKEGEYHFEDNLDLGAFIDLCKENGLYFFVRPGPFIMAEMKKEGIPYWVSHKHPNCVTIGFDGKRAVGNTIDYLEPGYLSECQKWYKKIMSILVPRLQSNGGNVIGVQLDNEIGMLNWVSNQPILNVNALTRFTVWLCRYYTKEALSLRYPFSLELQKVANALDSFDIFSDQPIPPTLYLPEYLCHYFRSPSEEYSVSFHFDYGNFLREYYAAYARLLKSYAVENGVQGVPFFINIHGTGEGRIFDYPLGVSQLSLAFNEDNIISGTDVYLGEPKEGTYQDMYVANAITNCMNKRENPLTSIEFEAGDGNYCDLFGLHYHKSATSQKMLQCLSQDARMLSFYLFSGGINYYLTEQENDGNGRMAFTGELHGTNAPVGPDGNHNYSFDQISKTAKTIHALNRLIASSYQEDDGVVMGFIPDYFLTELSYPSSKALYKVYENLKYWRCAGRIDSIARGLLSNHICFTASDIQHDKIPDCKMLFLLSARYMPGNIQKKLVDFVEAGGKLTLYGELPLYDLEGNPCTILKDACGLKEVSYLINEEPRFFLTIECCGNFKNLIPSERASYAQCFSLDEDAILTPYQSNKMCGFLKQIKKGQICAITTDYPPVMPFYQLIWEQFKIKATLTAPYYRQGIYLACTISKEGERLLYVLNLDTTDKMADLYLDGTVLFSNFLFTEKCSLLLPVMVKAGPWTIAKSTAQIAEITECGVRFFLTQNGKDTIHILGKIKPSKDYVIETFEDVSIVSFKDPYQKECLVLFD